jgi:hypothetical protein
METSSVSCMLFIPKSSSGCSTSIASAILMYCDQMICIDEKYWTYIPWQVAA